MNKKWLLLLFLLPLFSLAQEVDTLAEFEQADSVELLNTPKHSPKKAALYSAVVPGLGQAYNKKYWKIPIVYAGLGAAAYFIRFNYRQYDLYRNAYIQQTDSDSTNNNAIVTDLRGRDLTNYDAGNLLEFKNFYRTNLDISVIVAVVVYALNIIDAVIDAHLYEFDVSEDLSLRIEPQLQAHQFNQHFAGIKLNLQFK